MSTKFTALPAGWSTILDEVQARLDQAITSVNARIEQMPPTNIESIAQLRGQEIMQWSERLRRIRTYLESAEQVVQSVDEMLHKEELQLREQLARSETLKQKSWLTRQGAR